MNATSSPDDSGSRRRDRVEVRCPDEPPELTPEAAEVLLEMLIDHARNHPDEREDHADRARRMGRPR